MKILSCITGKKGCVFVGGLLAGLVLPPVVKSKTLRKAAVSATAKGMKWKDDTMSAYESIKEEAQDVYAEAKEKNMKGDGPEA